MTLMELAKLIDCSYSTLRRIICEQPLIWFCTRIIFNEWEVLEQKERDELIDIIFLHPRTLDNFTRNYRGNKKLIGLAEMFKKGHLKVTNPILFRLMQKHQFGNKWGIVL